MKATRKTPILPRIARKPHRRRAAQCRRAVFTLVVLAAARTDALTPEAQDVLAILEGRILSAEAGQASRDLFLESLESGDGCREWEEASFWRRDPDLRAALEAACPDFRESVRGRIRRRQPGRGADAPADSLRSAASLYRQQDRPQGRLRLVQGMRPLEEGPSPPPEFQARLSASPEGPVGLGGGAEATLSGSTRLRRRAWLGGRGFSAQAGRLAFGSEGPAAERAAASPEAGIPHLDFVTGRSGFPGAGGVSGVAGAWEARSPALDGLGFAAPLPGMPNGQVGGFGSWNRLVRPAGAAGSGTSGTPARRDALAYALGARGASHGTREGAPGSWAWALQGARLRLEDTGGTAIWLLGAAVQTSLSTDEDGGRARWRTGMAVSRLSRISRLDAEAGRDPDRPGELGAYWEAEGQGENPDRWSLALHQATSRWANPLAAGRASTRDTLAGGWILPGRGEGGVSFRTRMDLFRGGSWRVAITAGGETGWSLAEGFLAAAGRFTLGVGAGAWEARSSRGLAWRAAGAPSDAPAAIGAQTLAWSRGPWRAEAAVSRLRGTRDAWPVRVEMGRSDRQGNRWTLEGSGADLRHPFSAYRILCRQSWRMGSGIRILQSVSIPMERLELQQGMGYRLGLEIAGF